MKFTREILKLGIIMAVVAAFLLLIVGVAILAIPKLVITFFVYAVGTVLVVFGLYIIVQISVSLIKYKLNKNCKVSTRRKENS